MSLLRFCFPDDLQRLNALKNVLAGVANGVAAILFIAVADVAWEAAGLIAVGSIVGAQVGARYGRHIPSEVLRWIVVIGGAVVAVILLVTALTSPPLCPSNMTASLSAPGRVDMSPRSVPPSSG